MSNVSNTDVTYENNGLSSSTSTDTNTKKGNGNTKKKKDLGRTRKVFKSEWKDVKRKSLKNLGLSYVSRDGKEKPSKSLSLPCGNSCRLKCTEKIPNDLRQKLFDQFWSLGNRVRQWEYLANCCEKIIKRRITTENDSKRKCTIRYYLLNNMEDIIINKENKILVCKTMFLNTFSIGDGLIRTAKKSFSRRWCDMG